MIVFDLDDTLLDTTRLLIPIANTPEFQQRIRSTLPLMDGASENLTVLSQKYQLCLVTMGNPETQRSKIQSLGIEKFFKKIYFANPENGQTKSNSFRQLLVDFGISPEEFLSIGNRRSVDIRLAKELGAKTCLFVHGEHQNEKIELPWDKPDHQIHHHHELISGCRL